MASLLQIEGDASVLLRVTHSNLKSFAADIRFSLQMSVETVKDKLGKKCGTSVSSMQLELYDDCISGGWALEYKIPSVNYSF
ncbi:hypothetical protein HRI_003061600 [Hibiscus trionum]|uniref:Ubiquitin-like domain-containing protein n=1 Tax=Hibiscus trionum TaxID=183268 RepID=A0A9W7IGN2_HIBTR|nr:hypothetical protein HRI_003061600 [Hibiscus trionum]